MKRVKNLLILLAAVLLMASVKTSAQINAGISMGRGGLNGFFLTMGNYFRVPQREIIVVRDRRLPDEEIPVVFFVARRAGVSPREVAGLRRRGYSWMDITYQYGLDPGIFFPGRNFNRPPHGRAWGYYKHHRGYSAVSDYDIINAVNSRMISECYKCGEGDVMRMRNQGRSYSEINDMYYGKGRGSEDDYNYHNRDRQDNDNRNWNDNSRNDNNRNDNNRNDNNRNDNYGYGDPGNR